MNVTLVLYSSHAQERSVLAYMEERKKLPIGIEFFKDFKSDNFYYVDKTGFISELIRTRGSVNLFTRPRRFGKSLNIDMLKSFFEIGADVSLFDGLEISKETELCEQYMGKYPVISVSLKDVDGENYQAAFEAFSAVISEEATRLDYLLQSDKLTQYDKAKLVRLIEGELDKPIYLQSSLKLLTSLLYKHYGVPAIVLIDEYDVPLDKAYQKGYYSEMIQLIRLVFSLLLKTNVNMYFAVITGCLRITRESIFTGLNNFKVCTISDVRFAEYFGFTNEEVKTMLSYYGLEDKYNLLKEWYDGYHFGNVDVYCPWSVINQCDQFCESRNVPIESHWANSSNNVIIKDIIEEATESTRADIEALISGQSIKKKLVPELTYTDFDSRDVDIRQLYLWSVLFATGYITDAEEPKNGVHTLMIPNKEVLGIFDTKIQSWLRVKATGNTVHWHKFCNAFKEGDAETVQMIFNEFMADSISIQDTFVKKEMKENFYHGMLLGLLKAEGSWIVKSNAESGIGYTDIKLEIPSERTGCIIEVKYAESGTFEAACQEAMNQIEDDGYVTALRQEGMHTIHKFGIACYKKNCRVVYDKEEKI